MGNLYDQLRDEHGITALELYRRGAEMNPHGRIVYSKVTLLSMISALRARLKNGGQNNA